MTLSDKTLDTLQKSIKIIKKLVTAKSLQTLEKASPNDYRTGMYFNFDYSGSLQIEARTQKEVKAIRACFRGVLWRKNYVEYAQQWEYVGVTRDGVQIRIHGVKEGPAQCKMVEETVMEEREVPSEPVRYVKQMVEVKRVRYICPDGDKANGS